MLRPFLCQYSWYAEPTCTRRGASKANGEPGSPDRDDEARPRRRASSRRRRRGPRSPPRNRGDPARATDRMRSSRGGMRLAKKSRNAIVVIPVRRAIGGRRPKGASAGGRPRRESAKPASGGREESAGRNEPSGGNLPVTMAKREQGHGMTGRSRSRKPAGPDYDSPWK
jgi:hypothetical protein